jgi:hypothetical protein
VISRLEIGGKIIGCSLLAGGIFLLAAGFIKWRLSMKSQQTNEIEDNRFHAQVEAWRPLLRRGECLLTNESYYAYQCINQLAVALVPTEGYQHLIVWNPSRQSPSLFSRDGVAPPLVLKVRDFPPQSILVIVIVEEKVMDYTRAKLRSELQHSLKHSLGADSPLVLHLVKVHHVHGWFDNFSRVTLSKEQCEAIRNHQGELLSE